MKEQSISYYDDYVDDNYVVKEGEGFFSPFTFLCSVLVLSLFGFIALLSSTMDKAIMEGVPFYSYLGKELLGAALGLGLGILTYIVPDNVLNKLHFVTCPISIVLLTLSKFVQELSFLSFSGGVFSLITLVYFIAWSVPFVMEKERKGFPLLAIIPFFILYLSVIGYTAGLGWYVVGLVIIIAAISQFEAGKGSLFFFFLTGLVILVLLSIIPSVFNGISSSILPVNDMSLYNKDLLVSRMAIIDGGMSGSGLGQGLYKLEAFETPHKEFIFATIFEETGLIGLSLILVPSIIILIVGIRTANRARSNKELSVSATVIGGVSLIVFAVLLNILRVMGFNPFGGLCLPFFSYDPLSEGAFVFLSVILYRLIYREGRQKDDKE